MTFDPAHTSDYLRLTNNGSTVGLITNRLMSYYTTGDYNPATDPGEIGNGGHRVNFVSAAHDVATAAREIGLTSAQIIRLETFYNGITYNAVGNPGGLARGGHRINFYNALSDMLDVGREIALMSSGVAVRVSWFEFEARVA